MRSMMYFLSFVFLTSFSLATVLGPTIGGGQAFAIGPCNPEIKKCER